MLLIFKMRSTARFSYDLVSLLRDAFIEWEEEFVLDLVIRYWEKARAAGLPVSADFDAFYRERLNGMGRAAPLESGRHFARLYYRDGKDKYRPEIPRFFNYLRRAARRYNDFGAALMRCWWIWWAMMNWNTGFTV